MIYCFTENVIQLGRKVRSQRRYPKNTFMDTEVLKPTDFKRDQSTDFILQSSLVL